MHGEHSQMLPLHKGPGRGIMYGVIHFTLCNIMYSAHFKLYCKLYNTLGSVQCLKYTVIGEVHIQMCTVHIGQTQGCKA